MARILIFVSKTGGGHVSLGESLRDLIGAQNTVELIDPQPRFIHWHYRVVSRHALWLWEWEYRMSDGPRRSRLAHALAGAQAPNIIGTIQRFKPDLIMTTYPFLADEVMFSMRLWKRVRRPFVMLLSDPGPVHASWLTERNADAVFAPTRETCQQALDAGIKPENLHLTGWPVRGQFYQTQPARGGILSNLGLDPQAFTVFIQGGGEGAAGFASTLDALAQINGLQVILAAGTNQALFERYRAHPKVHALPFTREISRYMSAADVVMGKAGPNILLESTTLGKPFIATSYIPGQEAPNLEFIRRHGLGWVALDQPGQLELLTRLVAGAPELETVRASVEKYRAWNTSSVQQIPRLVAALLEKSLSGEALPDSETSAAAS